LKIINSTKNTILAEDAVTASTLWRRMKGLLGEGSLNKGSAMVLKPCNSVHTFFMRFAIDVIFVDDKNCVIKTFTQLKPFRLSPVYYNAAFAIELPFGAVKESATSAGDFLILEE